MLIMHTGFQEGTHVYQVSRIVLRLPSQEWRQKRPRTGLKNNDITNYKNGQKLLKEVAPRMPLQNVGTHG